MCYIINLRKIIVSITQLNELATGFSFICIRSDISKQISPLSVSLGDQAMLCYAKIHRLHCKSNSLIASSIYGSFCQGKKETCELQGFTLVKVLRLNYSLSVFQLYLFFELTSTFWLLSVSRKADTLMSLFASTGTVVGPCLSVHKFCSWSAHSIALSPPIASICLAVTFTSLAIMATALYNVCHGPQCVAHVLYGIQHTEESQK